MSYIDTIKDRARIDKKTIVLPESNDKRTLIAASHIIEEGIANIIMVGDEEKIMDGARWLEVDLDGVTVVNPKTSDKLDSYVNLLYETRKSKGMTPEKAREILLVGGKPIIAMLSHSTKGSAKHALVDKVVEATRIAHEQYPGLTLDGELQLDAALVQSVGKSKAPGSEVAGHANVLIFPNLDCGNIGYKLVQRLANAEAYGPMLQGISKPVNDLSRGCSWQDIVGVVALTAVQAQG